jgi:hypothetical protein
VTRAAPAKLISASAALDSRREIRFGFASDFSRPWNVSVLSWSQKAVETAVTCRKSSGKKLLLSQLSSPSVSTRRMLAL